MSSNPVIHVVTTQIGGFAREDDPVTHVVGAYSSPALAELVRKACGYGAAVTTIELDAVPPGYVATAQELYPEAAAALLPAAPAAR